MAYNSVGTPRFYIDYISNWLNLGILGNVYTRGEKGQFLEGFPAGLDVSDPCKVGATLNQQNSVGIIFDFTKYLPKRALESINYMGFLGHTLNRGSYYFDETTGMTHRIEDGLVNARIDLWKRTNFDNVADWEGVEHRGYITSYDGDIILNAQEISEGGRKSFPKSGASLWGANIAGHHNHDEAGDTLDPETGHFLEASEGGVPWDLEVHGSNTNRMVVSFMMQNPEDSNDNHFLLDKTWDAQLNGFCLGHYYDMPNSPDLSLSMDTQFDGIESSTTAGGSTIQNIRYKGAPKWGELNPWEIGASEGLTTRNGRRVWNLRFGYISNTDIFASNYMTNTYMENSSNLDSGDVNVNDFQYTMEDDDSISAKLLNYIAMGQKFIFQPDNTANNPSDFAICVLDQKSLRVTQVAYNAYNIRMKIKEVL